MSRRSFSLTCLSLLILFGVGSTLTILALPILEEALPDRHQLFATSLFFLMGLAAGWVFRVLKVRGVGSVILSLLFTMLIWAYSHWLTQAIASPGAIFLIAGSWGALAIPSLAAWLGMAIVGVRKPPPTPPEPWVPSEEQVLSFLESEGSILSHNEVNRLRKRVEGLECPICAADYSDQVDRDDPEFWLHQWIRCPFCGRFCHVWEFKQFAWRCPLCKTSVHSIMSEEMECQGGENDEESDLEKSTKD